MKNFLSKIRGWIKNHKTGSWIMFIMMLFLISACLYAITIKQEKLIMKQEIFEVNVNEELSQDITIYYDGIQDIEKVEIDFSNVDYKKLGEYEGKLLYKKSEYPIKFKVVDREAPVLSADTTKFNFPLDSSKEDVNNAVNAALKITDNYDKEFKPLEIITEIPSDAGDINKSLSVKDTSENQSNEISITITFESVDIPEDTSYSTPSSATPPAGNKPNTSQRLPEVAPTPQPKPTPTPEPEVPTYTTPAGAVDGGLFNSEDEGWNWALSHIENPDSPYYYCNAFGNSFSNGQWHFYIEPCNN